jgi:pSer/pThr/pTyr-binding forkhead associated (FHA) protein
MADFAMRSSNCLPVPHRKVTTMSNRVTLTVQLNHRQEQEHVFDETAICTFGRADDCHIRVPGGCLYANVSRRHCVFEIDPPHVRVRDLGSYNGTHINGRHIGQRPHHLSPKEVEANSFPAHELHDGDIVRAGSTFIHVEASRAHTGS